MADPSAGELVTETFAYDGARQVTVYVPPDPPEAVVFAQDAGHSRGGVLDARQERPVVDEVHGGVTTSTSFPPGGLPARGAGRVWLRVGEAAATCPKLDSRTRR